MSKQTEAKQEQGYRTDPQNCGNCMHRVCAKELSVWMQRENQRGTQPVWIVERHGTESKQRCGIGGFAIKKTATCGKWEFAA